MVVPERRETAPLPHQFTAWRKFPGQGKGGGNPKQSLGVELIRQGLRLRRLGFVTKNSGEKGAAHGDFWKSVEGASKLWLNN